MLGTKEKQGCIGYSLYIPAKFKFSNIYVCKISSNGKIIVAGLIKFQGKREKLASFCRVQSAPCYKVKGLDRYLKKANCRTNFFSQQNKSRAIYLKKCYQNVFQIAQTGNEALTRGYFQQDEVPEHTALNYLEEFYEDRLISFNCCNYITYSFLTTTQNKNEVPSQGRQYHSLSKLNELLANLVDLKLDTLLLYTDSYFTQISNVFVSTIDNRVIKHVLYMLVEDIDF